MKFVPNFIWYLIIVAVLAAVLTPIGLAALGITIVSVSILGVLAFYFMPALLMLLGALILFGIIPIPKFTWRIAAVIICFVGAWALWNGVI